MSNARIQFSLATEEVWLAYNPFLKEGEIVTSVKANKKVKLIQGKIGGSNYSDSTLIWDQDNAESLTSRSETAATTAATKASAAASSASAAAASQAAAANSASAAAASASAAKSSETTAKASETAVANSAKAAAASASTASEKATAAANSASAAASSASQAQSSASTATTKASEAETSATAAFESKTAAATSASTAGTKASEAANSASAAAGSASNAAASASAASASAEKVAALNYSNAAAHNAIYRGKYLGASVTTAQWAAIKAGTFDDLYIGDYWTIGGVDYVIAAFDYYLNTGDSPAVTAHHVTIVPRKNLYNHVMNDTNVVTGAYVGSKMYASGLNSAKTTIANAFGSAHILTIRQLYTNATNADYGFGTGFAWYDASVFLMDEVNVYGGYVFTEMYRTTQWGSDKYSVDNSQYPVFAFDKTMIHTRQDYWLRNVADSGYFCSVDHSGLCSCHGASDSLGVWPAFNIYQS